MSCTVLKEEMVVIGWASDIFCCCALILVVPVATSVSADETEALKAEITKAVEKVQEAGEEKKTNPAEACILGFNIYRCVVPKSACQVLYYSCRSKHPDLVCM